jgi:hypothetical protein
MTFSMAGAVAVAVFSAAVGAAAADSSVAVLGPARISMLSSTADLNRISYDVI